MLCAPFSHTVMDYSLYLNRLIKTARTYHVRVRFVRLMPKSPRHISLRGAFRAGEILLPVGNDEEALFILLHAMGHLAQWEVYPEEHVSSYAFNEKVDTWDRTELKALLRHEREAVPFTLGFLKKAGCAELTDWYVRYTIADQGYIADTFSHNQYRPSRFVRTLRSVRTIKNVARVQARAFPASVAQEDGRGYIHII